MKKEQCPICYSDLEKAECTPCHDCGWVKERIDDFLAKEGNFNVYELYDGLALQLCDPCKVDFGSYKSEFLGFKDGTRIGFENMNFVKSVDNSKLEIDKWCPECKMRLKFLSFISDLREKLETQKQ